MFGRIKQGRELLPDFQTNGKFQVGFFADARDVAQVVDFFVGACADDVVGCDFAYALDAHQFGP